MGPTYKLVDVTIRMKIVSMYNWTYGMLPYPT